MIERAERLIEVATRDQEYLCSKGFDFKDVTKLQKRTEKFRNFKSDRQICDELIECKEHCVVAKRELVKQLRLIQAQLSNKGLEGTEEFTIIKKVRVHDVSYETVLKGMRKVLGYSVQLSSLGIPMTAISKLSQLILDYEAEAEAYEALLALRKSESKKRMALANELAEAMQNVCKFGKLVFTYVDEEKYKDYVMYS